MGLERIIGNASLKRYFDSDYIGAYSIDNGVEPILTIESLWYGEVVLAAGRKEPHVIVQFKEKVVHGIDEVKPLILNATNRKTLKKLYGADTAEALEGKSIQLYIDPRVRDPQDGGFTEGLRIRPYKPKAQAVVKPQDIKCADCGKEISPSRGKTALEIVARTVKKYGAPLCAECATIRANNIAEEKKAGEETDAETETEVTDGKNNS